MTLRLRPDLERIRAYVPGRGEREVLEAYGLESLVKLASNESPVPPFPEVVAAIAAEAGRVNRYPETVFRELGSALGAHLGVDPASLWFGSGGAEILRLIAYALGGSGTSAVFPHPSFVMYTLATALAGSEAIAVPLDGDQRHDLEAMRRAVRDDTTVMYVCNPNNPTGTHVPTADVVDLIDAVPESVLIVVDEAYLHYVAADDYHSLVPLALERPNVIIIQTFSKIYGLAGLRVGYAVGRAEVINELRKAQSPFTVTQLAQAAATEALRHPDRIARRIAMNADGRRHVMDGLASRGTPMADSQTNFVFARLGDDPAVINEEFLRRGVILRPTGTDWLRITVGTEAENDRFLEVYDEVRST